MSAFTGSVHVIETAKRLLARPDAGDLERAELTKILLRAAEAPGTIPEVVSARLEAEGRQRNMLDGHQFAMDDGRGGRREVTTNDIDEILRTSRDLDERRRAWEGAKEVGPVLEPGLIDLQGLRNQVAREMGYPGFFSLQVADYGMSADEMIALLDGVLADLAPLYAEIHCWAKHELAERFGQAVPRRIPAHWIGNRWAQEWPGLVEGVDLDPYVAAMSREEVVETAERFYVSMGFPELPAVFWEKSDLYPAEGGREKNDHASAWHVDLRGDIRSLMSVIPNWQWLETTHHELGHIYYYVCYSRPEVPYLLREGANRGFHEGIGELISLAAGMQPYVHQIGVLPESVQVDAARWQLDEALKSVVFMMWGAGVMTHFERDLYDGNLPAEQYNARWWEYVRRYQGVDPPAPRGEEFCDAATKTHINDDPAQYYDYAMATIIKFQLHDHIAREILRADPSACSYYGNEDVGAFLRGILEKGATEDWREVIEAATGEPLSGRAMLEYYRPVMDWLERENAGRDRSFD
jgi:peptidyl-dipeptidase A